MSVLDQRYRRWEGTPTPFHRRLLVIPRFALADLAGRRAVLFLSILTLVPSLLLAVGVYVTANLDRFLQVHPGFRVFGEFDLGYPMFRGTFSWQLNGCILLAMVAGPRLLAPDLTGNALPLYFSKALRRVDYIVGKCLVLFTLLSAVSFLPLLAVAGLRWSLAEDGAGFAAGALTGRILLVGPLMVLFLTLVTTAIAAQVRRAWLAPFLLLGLLVTTGLFGALVHGTTGSGLGLLFSPLRLIEVLADWAMTPLLGDMPQELQGLVDATPPVSEPVALAGLGAWMVVAAALLLWRIRPVEVVR